MNKILNFLKLLENKDYINGLYIEETSEGIEVDIDVSNNKQGDTVINIIEEWIKENGLVIKDSNFIELYYCPEDKDAGEPPISLRHTFVLKENKNSKELLTLFNKRINEFN